MAPLKLLFDQCENDLHADFCRIEHGALGISFADGSNPANVNGTVIFSGVAFDYTVTAASKPDAKSKIFCDADLGKVRSAVTLSLGAAVASGQHMPAIIQALMMLGEKLGTALGANWVYWTPASITTGFSYYSDTVEQYANGAAFPALVTVNFDTAADEAVRTTGLYWLVGQELLFERSGMPLNEAMRYVVRIVHDLATNGAVNGKMEVPGMADDERLILEPDAPSHLLSVRRTPVQNGVHSFG